MAVKNFVQAIPISSLDSAGIGVSYLAINAGGLPEACFLVKIINNSNTDVTISYDGINDNDFMQDGEIITLNLQTNSQPNNHIALMRKGTVIYAKGTAGVGLIYVVGYYQAGV